MLEGKLSAQVLYHLSFAWWHAVTRLNSGCPVPWTAVQLHLYSLPLCLCITLVLTEEVFCCSAVGEGSYQHLISNVSFVLVAFLLFCWGAVSGKSVSTVHEPSRSLNQYELVVLWLQDRGQTAWRLGLPQPLCPQRQYDSA